MAQVQLDNYSGSKHEETSQDSLTEVDESRPPDPSLPPHEFDVKKT